MDDAGSNINETRIRELAYQLWEQDGRPDHPGDTYWHGARARIGAEEADYDKTMADSFPASDPPAHSGVT